MRLKFDSANNVLFPTFVLAKRNGWKIGAIPMSNVHFTDRLNAYSEISFQVYKYNNNSRCDIWYQVESLKLVFCPEWNMWFEIRVEINEADTTIKDVEGRSLGEAELSQTLIHTTEINTEDDILRDDYRPTVLWNAGDPQASLLNRIMEKVPHYRIKHVDESIKRIQRTFSFDNISVYDAFQEIAKEIKCLFIIETKTTENKLIDRTVSVYDLETVCNDCGCRGEFIDTCSKCGSKNVKSGYGNDTTIFVSTDNLADNITYSVDVDSVKNCFKLSAGDDLMTATIRNCNPNRSDYIWFFDPRTMENMSKDLTLKLDEYNSQYEYYQTQYKFNVDPTVLKEYNDLVDKYVFYNDSLKLINNEISGFASLMDAFYNTINFGLYLSDGMMPSMDLPETTAAEEAKKLNAMNLSAVAVMNTQTASEATVTSAALSYARVIVDSRYQVKVNEGSFSNGRWSGNFKITRYSDDNDTAISNSVTVTLSDDYGTFVKQKIDKLLAKERDSTTGIVALFGLSDTQFKAELRKYCLASLTSFYECCQSCIDVLIEQGVADSSLWNNQSPNLYEVMYLPYRNKLDYISDEIAVRENEIIIVEGKYDENGKVEKAGMQSILSAERNKIQSVLDFQSYLGDELWEEFSSYRRESLYKNDNYISDGLNDTELFKNALEFLENARKELYKSAVLQHSISSTLKNLLVMKEFKPIVNYFDVGNWLRIRVDDKVYKLRLIEYKVDFDNLDTLSVDFSDVMETADGISDFDSILKKAMSMSSSYGSVAHQAEAGNQSFKQLNDWVEKGLNVTNQRIMSGADNQDQIWDKHGMLLRKYDEISDSYEDDQIKIINSTLAMTNDNWKTVRTAIGKYYFFDPTDDFKLKVAYGVIAETIVGKMILGEQLGIYTDNGSMSFDKNGLNITNGINNFNVNPNSNDLMTISNSERDLLRFDENGQLYISGDGSALDINANDAVTGLHSRITQTAGEIRLEVEDINNGLHSLISQTEEKILLQVEDVDNRLSSGIEINADQISSLVTKTDEQGKSFTEFVQGYDNFKSSVVTIDNSGNFIGTEIEQNSEHVRIAWNQCSDYIQFENGEINIYNKNNLMSKLYREGIEIYDGNSTPLSKLDQYGIRVYDNDDYVLSQFDREGIKVYDKNSLVMKLDWTGTNYYIQDRKVGNIGLGIGVGDLDGYYGMIMGVTDSNDFVGLGEPNPDNSNYRPVFAFYGHRDEIWAHKPLIVDADLNMRGHKIYNAVIEAEDDEISGVGAFTNEEKTSEIFNSYKNVENESGSIVVRKNYINPQTAYAHVAGHNNSIDEAEGTAEFSSAASILSGSTNKIVGSKAAAIVCGVGNSIDSKSENSCIVGGVSNKCTSTLLAFVGAGMNNKIAASSMSIIGAGYENTITNSTFCFVGSGQGNKMNGKRSAIVTGDSNSVSGWESVIVAGFQNVITGSGSNNFIGSGSGNRLESYSNSSGIVSGVGNTVNSTMSAILTGCSNKIKEGGTRNAIVCGYENAIETDVYDACIVSGNGNKITSGGHNSLVCGQSNECASNNCIVCGIGAKATSLHAIVVGGAGYGSSDNAFYVTKGGDVYARSFHIIGADSATSEASAASVMSDEPSDLSALKEQITQMKTEIEALKTEIDELKGEVA